MSETVDIAGERVAIRGRIPGDAVLVRLVDGVDAGTLFTRLDGEALFVEALVIASEYRGYGLGTEAAGLLREFAEAAGCIALTAWAPPHLGLSVYFWCRMGLRPLHGEGPNAGLRFERRLR